MTWTLEASMALAGKNVSHRGWMTGNADYSKIYIVTGGSTLNACSFIIWEIDTTTWAQTNISASESWSSSDNYRARGLAWYDGELYLAYEDRSGGVNDYRSYVYVWDGTGTTTWTASKTLTGYDGDLDTMSAEIGADSRYLYAYAAYSNAGVPSSANAGMFRFDGTWHGPDDDPENPGDFFPVNSFFGTEHGSDDDLLIYSPDNTGIMHYDEVAGAWEVLAVNDGDLQNYIGGNSAYTCWVKTDNYVVTSEDDGVTYNDDGSFSSPYGLVWRCGDNLLMGCTGSDDDSHRLRTTIADTFTLHDTLPTATDNIRAFWTDGDTLFCLADNSSGTGGAIYSNVLTGGFGFLHSAGGIPGSILVAAA